MSKTRSQSFDDKSPHNPHFNHNSAPGYPAHSNLSTIDLGPGTASRINPGYMHDGVHVKSDGWNPAYHNNSQQNDTLNYSETVIVRPPTWVTEFQAPNTSYDEFPRNSTFEQEYINSLGPNDEVYLKFTEATIRRGFVRKVFIILALQILVTAGIIAFIVLQSNIKVWMQDNYIFSVASLGAAFVLTGLIYCAESLRKKAPQNIILLGLLTIIYGLGAGSISAWYGTDAVAWAGGFTLIVCISLSLFSFQTKWEFNKTSGFVFVGILFLLLGLILLALFFWLNVIDKDLRLSIFMSYAGALILSFFLVWTLNNILRGQCCFKISPEEYIYASLVLYTHVLLVFLLILFLFAAGNSGGSNNCRSGACCVGHHGGYYGHYGHGWCCWGAAAVVAADDTATGGDQNGRVIQANNNPV